MVGEHVMDGEKHGGKDALGIGAGLSYRSGKTFIKMRYTRPSLNFEHASSRSVP